MTTALQETNGQTFSEWQKRLVKSADEEKEALQQEFIDAIEGGPRTLTSYLRKELQFDSLPKIPSLHRELTANEAFTPPAPVEIELWEHLEHVGRQLIRPHNASLPIFWYAAYITWIEEGWLNEDLHATLISSTTKSLDSQTRTALRNLGGLPEARGRVSVFSDCPLARVWWRCHIAEDAAKHSEGRLTFQQAHSALYKKAFRGEYSNDIWESFVLNPIQRVTSVNDSRLRAAIIQYLGSPDCAISTGKQYTSFAQNIARRIRFYSPQLLSWDTLQDLIQESAKSISETDQDKN